MSQWIFRKAIKGSREIPNLRTFLKYNNRMSDWVDYADRPTRDFVITSNILIGSVFPAGTIIRDNSIPSVDPFGNIVPLEFSMDLEVLMADGTRWIMDVENHSQSNRRHLLDRFRIYRRKENFNSFCKDNEFYQPNCIGELHIFPVDMMAYYCSTSICRRAVDYCRSSGAEWSNVFVGEPGVVAIDLREFGRYEDQPVEYLTDVEGENIWSFPIIERVG